MIYPLIVNLKTENYPLSSHPFFKDTLILGHEIFGKKSEKDFINRGRGGGHCFTLFYKAFS